MNLHHFRYYCHGYLGPLKPETLLFPLRACNTVLRVSGSTKQPGPFRPLPHVLPMTTKRNAGNFVQSPSLILGAPPPPDSLLALAAVRRKQGALIPDKQRPADAWLCLGTTVSHHVSYSVGSPGGSRQKTHLGYPLPPGFLREVGDQTFKDISNAM